MTIKTIEDAERIIEEFGELQELAIPVAEKMYELKYGRKDTIDSEDIILDGGSLCANFSEWTEYDGYEEHTLYIPLEYLFDEEWQQKAEEKIQRKREAAAEAERKRLEEQRQYTLERERKRYLELKAKFEGE